MNYRSLVSRPCGSCLPALLTLPGSGPFSRSPPPASATVGSVTPLLARWHTISSTAPTPSIPQAPICGPPSTVFRSCGRRSPAISRLRPTSGSSARCHQPTISRSVATRTLFVGVRGEPLHQAGASIKLHLEEPFYAGISACAHNKDAVERATFANLDLKPLSSPATPAEDALYGCRPSPSTTRAPPWSY